MQLYLHFDIGMQLLDPLSDFRPQLNTSAQLGPKVQLIERVSEWP